MSQAAQTNQSGRRASKDVRRQQLIDATISVLARKGYSALTVADVAKSAGLSAGIVNFHFESKDKLLAASLQFLTDEYRRNWKTALESAGKDPAQRLRSLLLSDFDISIYTSDKLAAWIAFWGEVQGRPIYDKIYSAQEDERIATSLALVKTIIAEGKYRHNAIFATRALESLCEGLWLGVVTGSSRITLAVSAADARQAVDAALVAFFPKHFK